MTLYLLEVHLQTFLSVPITKKCQILIVTLLLQMSDIRIYEFKKSQLIRIDNLLETTIN